MSKSPIVIVTACFGLVLIHPSDAAVIDGYQMATNDRFANSVSFIGKETNLSGVGMTDSGRWATVIGANTIISVNHFSPNGTVKFFPGNNPDDAVIERRIVGGQRIPDTDIWSGCLNTELPDSIHIFPFAKENLNPTNFVQSDYAGATAYMLGRSEGDYATVLDQAVGKNMIVGYSENDAFQSELGAKVAALSMVYDTREVLPGILNPNYVSYESHLQVGDSGAPLLLDSNGGLLLLGVNSFLTTAGNTASHVSYIGNSAAVVETHIADCAQSLPEPATSCLLLIGICGGILGNRLRNPSR